MIKLGRKQIDFDANRMLNSLADEMYSRYGILYFKDRKKSGDNIQFTCPFHANGQERRPSCGMNVLTGAFNCFTCGEKGSVEDFVSKCFRKNDNGEFGTNWLLSLFSDSVYSDRTGFNIQERKQFVPVEYVSEKELDKYRWYHEYMWKRRLTPQIVELFDIGYDKDTKCITFPVNDITGRCVFVARRSVNTKYFNYPKDVVKPVYALDKCLNSKTIYVCESFINALTLWTYGLKAVALLGTGDRHQYEILTKCSARKYYLCFDGDNAGKRGAERFIKNVKNDSIKVVVNIPEGKDVNDISKSLFFRLVTKADKDYNTQNPYKNRS